MGETRQNLVIKGVPLTAGDVLRRREQPDGARASPGFLREVQLHVTDWRLTIHFLSQADLRLAIHNGCMACCQEAAGHDSDVAILRAQPVGMINGHPVGGYTGRYEVIRRACGDDGCLSYDQVPPGLQKLRGPSESLASGLAALHEHIGLPG